MQFNEEMNAGPGEFKLTLFGALLRDKNPAFPIRLVDVEGFLLKPDTFPDRSMMTRRSGVAHVTRRYSGEQFSAAEWQSEERDRHLTEYRQDIQAAEEAMRRLRQ